MNINLKIKAVSLSILASLIMSAMLLWPAQALANGPICSAPGLSLSIPDAPGSDVPGDIVTDTLNVSDITFINDLNVSISTTHPYVGDLVFTLTHKVGPVISNTVIISRPLRGASVIQHEVSCSGDNIDVTLDDEAIPDIQVNCAEGTTHGDGTQAYVAGQSYRPYNPLSIFENDSMNGTWELSITDNYQADSGSLEGWCLIPNQEGDLQIFKNVTPSHPVQGQSVTYTLTYQNSSSTQTASNVVITDIVPSDLTNVAFNNSGATITPTGSISYTWQVEDLLPGDNGVITINGILNPNLSGGTFFNNTALITTTSVETNTNNNFSEAALFVQTPDLAISKTDGGITASPGDLITYTLTYANNGGAATGVLITETLPDNTSFNAAASSPGWQQVGATNQYTYAAGALGPGASQNITFTVSVTNPLPAGVTTVTNTVQIGDDGSNGADQDNEDNTSNDTTPVSAASDLAITKTDGGITVPAGSLITYTLTYSNSGNQNATGVTITETVPTNTNFNAASSPGWQQVGATNQYTRTVGNLSAGANQNTTFVVSVNDPLPAGVTTITNTAQIGDDGNNGSDPNSLNNTVSETTPIVTPVFKTFLPAIRKNN